MCFFMEISFVFLHRQYGLHKKYWMILEILLKFKRPSNKILYGYENGTKQTEIEILECFQIYEIEGT